MCVAAVAVGRWRGVRVFSIFISDAAGGSLAVMTDLFEFHLLLRVCRA